ncbi:hypothetical protein NLX83_06635 [Allokutzneria sp. A3M-2-11 16]|uniref:hypothetical protein n=1 Tax=Allokutzneria sp. A3M-2-11 16 TaxID=2962043 RepID=UPI0020B89C82|nr:hypothetical protein [Allokutzneria sp. A3M-2-11 16]MCP3798928.1 hypothetical protein [Allokutzneria sp. A3M-2-11 16]
MRRTLLAVVIATATLAGSGVAAASPMAEEKPWSASFEGATASGTSTVTKTSELFYKLDLKGAVTGTSSSDCYFVVMRTAHFGKPWSYTTTESAKQCGKGSTAVALTDYPDGITYTAFAKVCRNDRDTCGEPVSILNFG